MAQNDVDTAKSTLDAHRADQAAAEALLAKTTIRAPFAGRVGSRLVSVGDFVSPGTSLVTLVDNHLLKLRYDIAQKYIGRLALGQTASFRTMAYPDKAFAAMVDYIAPKIDNDMRTVQVEATLEDQSHQLSPGLSGEIAHTFSIAKDVLTIPEEAVMSAIDGESVYKIVHQEKALVLEKVLIKIGGYADGRVIVEKGLALGDEVVTEGQQKCRDGLHVKLQ